MNIEINVEDYLDDDEIKDICRDEIARIVYDKYSGKSSDIDTLISNLSYRFVWKMVDECVDGKLDELIRSNVVRVINELSSYSVFREANAWNKNESVGYKILQEEVAFARPLIKARVEKIVEKYPFYELKQDEIGDVVYDCIMDKLFGEKD